MCVCVSPDVPLQIFVSYVQMPPPASLSVSLSAIFFQSVSLSVPRQTLPSVPISLRLARPLPFHPCDPATAPFLLSVWLCFTQMPPTTAHSLPCPLSVHISASLLPPQSLYLCLYLFLTVSLVCFLPWILFSSYSPTAQMPGLVCNSCLAMCHYQVLPSTPWPSVCVCLGGGEMEGGGCRVD